MATFFQNKECLVCPCKEQSEEEWGIP
jgi:hypothetical protein